MSSAATEFYNSLRAHTHFESLGSFSDNAPFYSATQFGKGGKPEFYYLNNPTMWELYRTARNTEIGFRLTYGFAGHVWNNDFGLVFPRGTLNEEEVKEKNILIRKHLKKIKFYSEFEKATGFDFEQGESLALIYREGDGLEATTKMLRKPNFKKKVIRVEAINRQDYTIPLQGAFGAPSEYLIRFYKMGEGMPQYTVHRERAIRIKTQDINYNQFKGQAILRSCFSSIQILLNINQAASYAASRWGTGRPTIFTKNVKKKDLPEMKALIGNPLNDFWSILPSEFIQKIEMLGIGQGAMLDLNGLSDLLINQIVAASEIPRPILMGEVSGIVGAGEVNERSYYAALDKKHSQLEKFIYEFFEIDPEIKEILGDLYYEIDWGLRQVMTKLEKAEYNMKIYQNAISAMNYATLDECRIIAELPKLETIMDDEAAKYFYGEEMTAKMIGQLIPSLGQWRQPTVREVLETPEEREAKLLEENETEQLVELNQKKNTPNAQVQKPKNALHDPGKELKRRELKTARSQAMADKDKIRRKILSDVKNMTINEMYNEIVMLRKESSMEKIAGEINVSKTTLNSLFNNLKILKEKWVQGVK
jgi:hypothetical protein